MNAVNKNRLRKQIKETMSVLSMTLKFRDFKDFCESTPTGQTVLYLYVFYFWVVPNGIVWPLAHYQLHQTNHPRTPEFSLQSFNKFCWGMQKCAA